MRLYLIIAILLFSGSVFGCSCSPLPLEHAFEKADYVYVGRVISATVMPDEVVESKLQVQEVLKGTPDQFILVSAASFRASCEAAVVVSESYVVFGHYGKKPVLASCSDSQMLLYPEQIEELRNGS
ncbi:hypothetical protein QE250_16695 [Chromatiaceae bacterium AAb-1]|nr:hypothetical protein [Chromatiaceae bacterium AAb-1]